MAKKKAKKKAKARSTEAALAPGTARTPSFIELDKLFLDPKNPRLSDEDFTLEKQKDIVAEIVEQYDVTDLLSSLSVNGYFEASPVIGMEHNDGKIVVKEGNRRLTACLILAGDPRASKYEKLRTQYKKIQQKHETEPIGEIPVILLTDEKKLLSYLGVRHISPPMTWDSYAKARWVVQVMDADALPLDEVVEMLGDRHNTVRRMVEGYHFVHQLQAKGKFKPDESRRRGRGSNTKYPFSWVYTALGYTAVRDWLKLPASSDPLKKNPVPKDSLDDAGHLMGYLLGTSDRPAAIDDSREISGLADVVAKSELRHELDRGKSVEDVVELSRPSVERTFDALRDAQEAMETALAVIGGGGLNVDKAEELRGNATTLLNLARSILKALNAVAYGEPSESTNV